MVGIINTVPFMVFVNVFKKLVIGCLILELFNNHSKNRSISGAPRTLAFSNRAVYVHCSQSTSNEVLSNEVCQMKFRQMKFAK